MKKGMFVVLILVSILVVSISGCVQTTGLVNTQTNNHSIKHKTTPKPTIDFTADGNVVFNLNNTEAIDTGSLIEFIKYNPQTLESYPSYQYIVNHSIEAPDYFTGISMNNEYFGFTYEFNRISHPEYGDFELSSVIIQWSNGMMTPVTNYFRVSTEFSADNNWRIIKIKTDSLMRASLQYYANKGEIKSLIIYLHTTIHGKSKFIRITIDPRDIATD